MNCVGLTELVLFVIATLSLNVSFASKFCLGVGPAKKGANKNFVSEEFKIGWSIYVLEKNCFGFVFSKRSVPNPKKT
jgi:hypothetical protein